jgi:hypothetical protein
MKLKETLRGIIREEIAKALHEDANAINKFVQNVRKNVTRGGARNKVYAIAGAVRAVAKGNASAAFRGLKLVSANGPVTLKNDSDFNDIVHEMPKNELVNAAKQTLEHLAQRLTPEQFMQMLDKVDQNTRQTGPSNDMGDMPSKASRATLSQYLNR